MDLSNHGWMTYAGLGAIAVGFLMQVFGLGDCIPNEATGVCENAQQITENIFEAIDKVLVGGGTIVGTIGRARAAKKIAKLKGE